MKPIKLILNNLIFLKILFLYNFLILFYYNILIKITYYYNLFNLILTFRIWFNIFFKNKFIISII